MRPSVLPSVLCLAFLAWACAPIAAAQQPLQDESESAERFSVIFGGTRVGHLVATPDDGAIAIDFDFKNNGRGPTMKESLTLDPQGLPQAWTIQGTTTFGSKVEEHFRIDGDTARWTDSSGSGSAPAGDGAIYVGQSASPFALGVYARVLLADEDGSRTALPGGTLAITPGETLSVEGKEGSIDVRAHALTGLDLNPDHFLLDADNRLFAVISPNFVLVREGFEGEETRLRELATRLSTARLESIQQRTAHDYAAPVRIRNVRVFDPAKGLLTDPVSVVFDGNTITGVQPADAPATPGEVLVDGEGGTLVPGLYEMHAHQSQNGALLNLAAGVTSARDMGNNNAVLDKLVQDIADGVLAGPRITRSGFIEGKSPYSANNGILVDSQEAALEAVRWYAARDYWQVKLYNSMNPAWAKATVAEAHRLGLHVSGHVPAFANADAMIAAGFDELTHINQLMLGWVLTEGEDTRTLLRLTALDRLPKLDLASAPVRATLAAIERQEVAIEPTIAIHEQLLLHQDGEVPPGAVDYFDHMPVGWQRDARKAMTDKSDPAVREAYAGAWRQMVALLKEMKQRGIQLIPGTDLGGHFTFHRELELFQQFGFTAAEVLRLATLDMAKYLGQDQRLGSIERGKLADFFLVPGDPTQDLKAIKAIRMVVKDGTVYFPAEIHRQFGIKPFADAPPVQLPPGAPVQ